MDAELKIDLEGIQNKFANISYSKLNDTFKVAISDALEILRAKTEQELRAAGVNIDGDIHKGGRTYNSLRHGIVKEISANVTKGRVRVAPMSRAGGYPHYTFGDPSWALKWFELGTKERHKKGRLIEVLAKNTKHGKTRKKRLKGAKTGELKAYNFFANAQQSTVTEVNKQLNENVLRAIEQIFNNDRDIN